MRDITHKISTQRTALASSIIKMKPESVEAIKTNTTYPKKDILGVAKAAGFLAVKNTPQAIPLCHPIPIEDVTIDYEFAHDFIKILIEVQTIYKTGCEVEAMHGASLVALTIYDMIKPMDKTAEIHHTRLESKTGGKTDFRKPVKRGLKTAVIVMSDSISEGKKEDKAGKHIVERLAEFNVDCEHYTVIPDDAKALVSLVETYEKDGTDLVITCGGTGVSPRDITPETLRPLFTKDMSTLMEAARAYGQERTPYAMLSRGVAGFINETLVLTFPGSTKGTRETLDALLPYVFHLFKVRKVGYQHSDVNNV